VRCWGKLFDADHQRQWLDSLEPQDPSKPLGQKYGYGISQINFGPNSVYFHGGEMPGYNSFMGYDPVNDVTLIIWTSLTISLDRPADSQHHHAEDARPDLHGIAASVEARNVTGNTLMVPELTAKRLGLLPEAVPSISRVLVLSYLADPIASLRGASARASARSWLVTYQIASNSA
jgi:hypothetical protein